MIAGQRSKRIALSFPSVLWMVLWMAAFALGCTSHDESSVFEVKRLGAPVARKLIAKESREVLPTRASLEIEAPLAAGCLLDLAFASNREDLARTFRVAAHRNDGGREVLVDRLLEGAGGWIESRSVVSGAGFRSLEFSIEGETAGAFWERPIARCPASPGASTPVNVILVSLDTLRADRLGAYGNEDGLSPNLDRIASEGTLFENAYASYPNTLSSHASLFTGYYPSQHGMIAGHLSHIPDDARTLARAFADAGYETVAFTEDGYVASNFGFGAGFDRYHNGSDLVHKGEFPGSAAETYGRAIAWLEARSRAPFFMFLHTYEVHIPYHPDPSLLARLRRSRGIRSEGRFKSQFGSLWALSFNRGNEHFDEYDWRKIRSLYDAEVMGLDLQVGRLDHELAALDLAGNTLLVIVSDHGEEFDDHGFIGHGETLSRQALHVPVIFRQSDRLPVGRRIAAPVGLLDVGPTIAALAGIDPPFPDAPARSLLPEIRAEASVVPHPVFSELEKTLGACGHREAGDNRPCPFGGVAVREGRYGFIQRATTGQAQLYDYERDPGEHRDVAAEFPERAAHFQSLVDEYRALVAGSRRDGGPGAVDPEVRAKLEALGYVE